MNQIPYTGSNKASTNHPNFRMLFGKEWAGDASSDPLWLFLIGVLQCDSNGVQTG